MNPEDKENIDPALRKIMEIPDDQELPDDALIDVMLRALESQQLLIRSSAVHQLVDLGRRNPTMALPKMLKALDPEVDYWTVRFGAVEALGEIANKETVRPLVKFLKEDDDPDFRAMVAKQLGEMGDIAKEAGEMRAMNLVMVGALAATGHLPLTLSSYEEALKGLFQGPTLETNWNAFQQGYKAILGARDSAQR